MSVTAMITWRFRKPPTREGYKMIFECRAGAMKQSGYVSSETFEGYDNPKVIAVLSTWEDSESWLKWKDSPDRLKLSSKLEESYLEGPPEYQLFTTLHILEKL